MSTYLRSIFAAVCLIGLFGTYFLSAQWTGPGFLGQPEKKPTDPSKKTKPVKVKPVQTLILPALTGFLTSSSPTLSSWTDSTLATLSPAQRIGQLFVVALPNETTEDSRLITLLTEYTVGGISFPFNDPIGQVQRTNRWQEQLPIPLWLAAQIGPGLGLAGAVPVPTGLALGAVAQDEMLNRLGSEVAWQCRRAGLHQIFVPGAQAILLGDQPEKSQRKLLAYQNGLQTGNLAMVAGHLPSPARADQAPQLLKAGKLVFLLPADVPTALLAVQSALAQGIISQAEIDLACHQLLDRKEKMGLAENKIVETGNLAQDLHRPQAVWRSRQLAEASLTFLQNKADFLPISIIQPGEIASLAIGGNPTEFETVLARYAGVRHFRSSGNPSSAEIDSLIGALKKFEHLIISIHSPTDLGGLSPGAVDLVQELARRTQVALVFFASPYHLARLGQMNRFKTVLLAYEDSPLTQELAAQAVFGGVAAPGTLPVNLAPFYQMGAGQPLASQKGGPGFRFKYTVPEELGLDRNILQKADSLIALCVRERAAPGGVVFAAKDGNVFYFKAFGQHTYEGNALVQPDDLYDLASVTKIATSVASVMKLTDLGKFSVKNTWGQLDKRTRRTNKTNLTFADLLTHQAGLKAWIPFWKARTDAQGQLSRTWFSPDYSQKYPNQVANQLYIHKNFGEDSLISEILQSPLSGKKEYVYSDLSYYLYPGMVKRLSGQKFEDFLADQFYVPLGANTLTFNPLHKFPISRVVPTEYDSLFRRQLITGTVHDEGAALFGGISGHAGLFGNANDLAKLMQMYLNKGRYGGKQYIQAATLTEFARCQFCDPNDPKKGNQRGLGFDRNRGTNAAASASDQSFGHSGFTGTFAWMDPRNGLLYVFLSNRVYPTRNNSKLSDLNIRTGIQEVFYEALKKARPAQ